MTWLSAHALTTELLFLSLRGIVRLFVLLRHRLGQLRGGGAIHQCTISYNNRMSFFYCLNCNVCKYLYVSVICFYLCWIREVVMDL